MFFLVYEFQRLPADTLKVKKPFILVIEMDENLQLRCVSTKREKRKLLQTLNEMVLGLEKKVELFKTATIQVGIY